MYVCVCVFAQNIAWNMFKRISHAVKMKRKKRTSANERNATKNVGVDNE